MDNVLGNITNVARVAAGKVGEGLTRFAKGQSPLGAKNSPSPLPSSSPLREGLSPSSAVSQADPNALTIPVPLALNPSPAPVAGTQRPVEQENSPSGLAESEQAAKKQKADDSTPIDPSKSSETKDVTALQPDATPTEPQKVPSPPPAGRFASVQQGLDKDKKENLDSAYGGEGRFKQALDTHLTEAFPGDADPEVGKRNDIKKMLHQSLNGFETKDLTKETVDLMLTKENLQAYAGVIADKESIDTKHQGFIGLGIGGANGLKNPQETFVMNQQDCEKTIATWDKHFELPQMKPQSKRYQANLTTLGFNPKQPNVVIKQLALMAALYGKVIDSKEQQEFQKFAEALGQHPMTMTNSEFVSTSIKLFGDTHMKALSESGNIDNKTKEFLQSEVKIMEYAKIQGKNYHDLTPEAQKKLREDKILQDHLDGVNKGLSKDQQKKLEDLKPEERTKILDDLKKVMGLGDKDEITDPQHMANLKHATNPDTVTGREMNKKLQELQDAQVKQFQQEQDLQQKQLDTQLEVAGKQIEVQNKQTKSVNDIIGKALAGMNEGAGMIAKMRQGLLDKYKEREAARDSAEQQRQAKAKQANTSGV